MIIKSAQFVKSATRPGEYPDTDLPELAFAGRSNVGKSSLINTLVNRKNLVKTSSRPGCTQLINFFTVNDAIGFVDLPGYGYARVSKSVRARWAPMINRFLTLRSCLKGVILLQDIRRDPGREETELMQWMVQKGLPFLVVLTKADKLSGNGRSKRLNELSRRLEMPRDHLILFSAKTRMGRDIILDEISRLVEEPEPSGSHGT